MKSKKTTAIATAIRGDFVQSYQGEDLIHDVFDYIDGLDAKSLCDDAKTLSDARGFTVYVLGGILQMLLKTEKYKELGYSSFQQFVDEHLGLTKSSAYDWISIYDNVVESMVPWSQIEHLGWTKIRLFAKCLTPQNASYWIAHAEKMNAAQLRDFVRDQKEIAAEKQVNSGLAHVTQKVSTQVDGEGGKTPTPNDAGSCVPATSQHEKQVPPLVTPEVLDTVRIRCTFHLAPDQKGVLEDAIRLMKIECGSEYASVALTNICQYFLATYDPR